MINKQISEIIALYCESKEGKWIDKHPNRPNDNYSYIPCGKDIERLTFCLKHPEFAHFTHRDTYSVTIYWHCEGSPTGVRSIGAFDPEMIPTAYRILNDEIMATAHELYNY